MHRIHQLSAFIIIVCAMALSVGFGFEISANQLPDRDGDGVPDQDEITIYYTDPDDPDTDNDSYSDFIELNAGFSPFVPLLTLEDSDFDQDGLSDRMEYNFGCDPTNPDTDGDGFRDGDEVKNFYDPTDSRPQMLAKKIEVSLLAQKLHIYLNDVRMGTFPVSSGIGGSTPRGEYTVRNKSPKAWSPYGLWMPNWLGLDSGRIGLHQLPVWPNGQIEGEDHLGRPVSHGCVRLGPKDASMLYEWTPIGTKVLIY